MSTERLAALLDREAIYDCLHRSALANDLCDAAMWKSTYWPDGHEDHAPLFTGNAYEFIDTIIPEITRQMDMTWHQIGNTVVRLEGCCARVTSYAVSYVRMRATAGKAAWDLFAGVRYLDHFEKRDGDWRILRRITKTDWIRETATSLDWARPDPWSGQPQSFGARRTDDPLYVLFSGNAIAALRRGLGVPAGEETGGEHAVP